MNNPTALSFAAAIGEALKATREGARPHDAIAAAFDRMTGPPDALAHAARAGLEARVWQALNRERAAQREQEERTAAAQAGEPVPCLIDGCEEPIVCIERYKTSVGWDKQPDGSWELGVYDTGTHFHLFCAGGHESRAWANPDPHADGRVPRALLPVIYPGATDGRGPTDSRSTDNRGEAEQDDDGP